MSRDEEIKKAEIKYSDDTLFDGCDYVGQYAKQEAFIAGAKWADEHPKPEMVNRQEFLEKSCEYLGSVLEYDLGYYGARDFADTFRKTMEEQV